MALFLPNLKQRGQLDSIHMTVCSVGSRKNDERNDFGSQDWGLFAPNLSIYGFDADLDACDAANLDLELRRINWTERHFPYAIAAQSGEAVLYVTHDPQCSSLYPPNEPFLSRFPIIGDMTKLDFTTEIETITLDAALANLGVETVDFCQIDVQGADLHVLQGAEHLLEHSVLGLQIEVEFVPMYVNQPLFSDVDEFLRSKGFFLFSLDLAPRPRGGIVQSAYRPGQVLWGNACYFRDPLYASKDAFWQHPEQTFKLACIADALDFTDYALELLEHLTLKYGQQPEYNVADAIVASLQEIPDVVQVGLERLPIVQRLLPFLSSPINSQAH